MLYKLNDSGEPLCPKCGYTTNKAYLKHVALKCWHCGAPMAAEVIGAPPDAPKVDENDTVEHMLSRMRAAGWAVAVHNDYRIKSIPHTFWLWTNDKGRYVKGEGASDRDALIQCLKAARYIYEVG